jgi:phosphate:Na+ symporter
MQTPAIAVTQAERELARMGRMAADNLKLSLESFYSLDHAKAEKVLETEVIVNFLNHQITAWLVRIRGLGLSAPDIQRLGKMLHTVSDMERISDHAENIAEYTLLEESGAKISPEAMDELKTVSSKAVEICDLAVTIFESRDTSRLHLIQPIEDTVDDLCKRYVENHITRLNNEVCDPRGGVVFTDMLSDLERVADHCVNIANSILGETEWDKDRNELKIH